jgi:hypothetical protein
LVGISAYYVEADQQHWDGANCQEAEERRGWVATAAVAPARKVDVADIEKGLALRVDR